MMSKSDQGVLIIMLLLVLLYLAVWAMGYFTHKLPYFISALNVAATLAVVGYWVIKQLQIQQHYIELREMIVLGIEVIMFVTAIYAMASGIRYKWITTMQYILFGIHLLVLVIAVVFMFTFKMNKLM